MADNENSSVTVFNAGPSTISNGMKASYILGQSNYTTCAGLLTQSGLTLTDEGFTSCGVNYDASTSRVFVTDCLNNRVMIFDGSTISTNPNSFLIPGYE